MTPETQNNDLQALIKQHLQLMKWLIRVLAFQSIFVIAVICIVLWMMLPGLFYSPMYP